MNRTIHLLLFIMVAVLLLAWGRDASAERLATRRIAIAIPTEHDHQADTTTTQRVDTLREVVVEGRRELPVMEQFRRDIGGSKQPHVPSLGDVLNKVAPGLQDKMLHPFAVKERKRERKKKHVAKVLDEYDKVETGNSLLDEVIRKQREEDERNGMTNWQQVDKNK